MTNLIKMALKIFIKKIHHWIKILPFYVLFFLLITSCGGYRLKTFEFPDPVDTSSRKIDYQEKKIYSINDSIFTDNLFDGARLNNFIQLNDSTYQATILPENEPINESPHFAFRIWSKKDQNVYLQLNYPTTTHRYWPKLSNDGKNWNPIDSTAYKVSDNKMLAQLKLNISNDKLWIAAQEINNSSDVKNWAKTLSDLQDVELKIIGKSTLNRDLIALDVYNAESKNKDLIVILSRQHPPEVSGYLAMQSFVKELLANSRLSSDFRKKYRILIFPLINPDGVDLGHWRHNANGIDLNRDWAFYRQIEIKTITKYIVNGARKSKNKVILGLDFHSTQEDLYYSFTDDIRSVIYPFKDYWIGAIDCALPNYTPDDQPYAISQPISKAWFFKQFNAESITYESGDETPRDFVALKAQIAAREMMKLLILK